MFTYLAELKEQTSYCYYKPRFCHGYHGVYPTALKVIEPYTHKFTEYGAIKYLFIELETGNFKCRLNGGEFTGNLKDYIKEVLFNTSDEHLFTVICDIKKEIVHVPFPMENYSALFSKEEFHILLKRQPLFIKHMWELTKAGIDVLDLHFVELEGFKNISLSYTERLALLELASKFKLTKFFFTHRIGIAYATSNKYGGITYVCKFSYIEEKFQSAVSEHIQNRVKTLGPLVYYLDGKYYSSRDSLELAEDFIEDFITLSKV